MDKSRVTRQGTTRAPGRSSSTHSLVSSASRLRLPVAAASDTTPQQDSPLEGEASANASAFDALELLGPSLSEVLTFMNPPQPRRLLKTEQETGENTADDNQSFHDSSSSLGSQVKLSTKFDVRLSRSAVLGRLADPSVDNARKTQEYFAKLLGKLQCEVTGGLVLLHDASVVMFLETTAEQLMAILKQLQQQRIIDANSMKILANCDDNGARILEGLYFKKIFITRSDGEWTDDSAPQCVVETFLNLIKFVKKIGPMPPAEIRKCLTNLSNTDQSFLPTNELVLWLLGRDELMTIDEYLGFFDNPVAAELESERVWPVHPLINY